MEVITKMPDLYLWKLVNLTGPEDFDEMRACVVAAPHEQAARSQAARNHGTENGPQWLSPEWSDCTRLGQADAGMAAGLIVADFWHGHGSAACDYLNR